MAESSRIQSKADFALNHLKRCALVAVGRLSQTNGGFLALDDAGERTISFEASGVCNLLRFMTDDNAVHRNVTINFQKLWNEMKEEGMLACAFTAASMHDLTVFLAQCLRFKRMKKKRVLSQNGLTLRQALLKGLVRFLSACVENVVIEAMRANDIFSRQIPSRKRRRRSVTDIVEHDGDDTGDDGSRRRKIRATVDLDTIWGMLEHANQIHVSLPVYLQTQERGEHAGSHAQTSQMWMRKVQNMYSNRAALSFSGVKHVNIISDASRFSGRDTLVSIAYSVENDAAAYLNNQFLKCGKILGPDDLLLETSVEVLAAKRKVQRLASYCVLQALSNQLKWLTSQKTTLASFDYSSDAALAFAVKPLEPGILRIVQRDPSDNITGVYIQNKMSGELTKINLATAPSIRVLSLGMDQGPTNLALASYCGGTNAESAMMLHFVWDPFHRLNRDMKLSQSVKTIPKIDKRAAVKTLIQKTMLCSSFLWGLNYKPYNSAAYFQSKQELLESFLSLSDEDGLTNHD